MITVTASDGDLSVSDEFMGSITNTVPMVNAALADVTIESGAGFEVINISAVFSDANGDVLNYTVASSDETIVTAALSGDTLTLTEVGTGTATITVTASDGTEPVNSAFMVAIEEGALGIADTDILAVYPNPSSGVFELSRTVDVVSVYDMSGRLVYRGKNVEKLDLTNNPAGQYLVEVGVGKERGRYTVIKK